MDRIKQECKLCGNIISDGNFKVIEDVIKSIFDILELKLTLDNDSQNVICSMCSSKLLAALNFKSTCLYMDSSIIPYVDFENLDPVDLKDIYAKEKGNRHGSSMLDGREMCRLCWQPVNSDQKSMKDMPVDSVQLYMPEINFADITNTAICLKCHDELCIHGSFIRNCLDVEEKRNRDARGMGDMPLTNPCIKMEEIEIKSEKTDETRFEDVCNLKKEEFEEGNASFCLPDTGETKSLYDPYDQKQISVEATVASYKSNECISKTTSDRDSTKSKGLILEGKYQCHLCAFNTRYRQNFKKHQMTHKDPSELQMFQCVECDYKTIRRGHLRRHQLKHKDHSEVKMYECDNCNFTTKYKDSLIKHYLQHKDASERQMFECDECDYKSLRKFCLQQHQLRHKDPSEVPVFKCDECDYTNIDKGNLLKHQLRHKDRSGMRVFKCDECDYKSIRKGNLKNHQSRHRDPPPNKSVVQRNREDLQVT